MVEARVACRTPSPGKPGVTNIPKWKFDAIRGAVLDVLDDGDTAWRDLTDRVRDRLDAGKLARMGKLGWHVVTVKLELEVSGEIERVERVSPQLLRRTGKA